MPDLADLAREFDDLTPTEYLIVEVLCARHRLGEGEWTFPSHYRTALRGLEGRGLLVWKDGIIERTCLARLTVDARVLLLRPDYVPPLAVERVPPFDPDLNLIEHLEHDEPWLTPLRGWVLFTAAATAAVIFIVLYVSGVVL